MLFAYIMQAVLDEVSCKYKLVDAIRVCSGVYNVESNSSEEMILKVESALPPSYHEYYYFLN